MARRCGLSEPLHVDLLKSGSSNAIVDQAFRRGVKEIGFEASVSAGAETTVIEGGGRKEGRKNAGTR